MHYLILNIFIIHDQFNNSLPECYYHISSGFCNLTGTEFILLRESSDVNLFKGFYLQ